MKKWYVVQTQPRKEALAEWHLRNQRFGVFCPRIQPPAKAGRARREALRPFFPNYLFVKLDLGEDPWHSIGGTIGVARLVKFGTARDSMPAAVPAGLVDKFIANSGEGSELGFVSSLASGDRVKVVGGTFDGVYGILEKATQHERVTILLDLLARETRLKIDRSRLVPA